MSTYDELIGQIKGIRTTDDVIAGMVSQLELERLSANPVKIHAAFKNLKQIFPEMLRDLDFFRGNLTDFSERLEQILFNLEMGGILQTLNPSYEYYSINKETKERLASRVMNRFGSDEQENIKKMAVKFVEMIKR